MSESHAQPAAPLTRTVVRGVGVVGGAQLLTQVLTLAAYIVLARLAPPKTFGTFAAASVLVTFSTLLVESGMSAALIQRQEQLEEAAASAFVATAAGGLLFTLLSMAAAPLVGWYFGSGEITAIALAISPTHFVTSLGVVPNAMLQRRFAFIRRAVVDPGGVIGLGVGSAVGLAIGWGAWGLLLGAYASCVIRIGLLWLVCDWRPRLRLATFAMWRELARYGRHILGAEIFREGSRVGLTALIGRFAGTAQLGQYNFGSRIATQTNALFVSTGAAVLFPALSRIADESSRLQAAYRRALRTVCLVAVPGTLVYLGLGRQLVVVLLGARWETAGDVLVALAGLGLGGALISVGGETFKAIGQPRYALFAMFLQAVATIALVAALLPVSVVAAAAGISVASIITGAYAVYTAAPLVGVPRRTILVEVWPPALGGLVAAAVVLAADRLLLDAGGRAAPLNVLVLAAELALALASYAAVLRIVAPGRAEDLLRAVGSVLPRLRHSG